MTGPDGWEPESDPDPGHTIIDGRPYSLDEAEQIMAARPESYTVAPAMEPEAEA